MSHLFHEYAADAGEIPSRRNGMLVSMEDGDVTAFALDQLQNRGKLMVVPGDKVYKGMIVGENLRDNDLPVNPVRTKHLTNIRSQGDGKGIMLKAPLQLSLERALEYIAPDEYVEATPSTLRLRKKILDEHARKKAKKPSLHKRPTSRSNDVLVLNASAGLLTCPPIPPVLDTALLRLLDGHRNKPVNL